MSITFRSTSIATRARRLLAGLVIGGAASALAVAVVPQMADAHTDTSTGSGGTFRYAAWQPTMLAIGEKNTNAGWVPTFHTDGPIVAPASAVPNQYVEATFKLQYAARWDQGVNPRWTVVDTQSVTKGLADFDKAGLAGTKKLSDLMFAPTNAAHGYYRVQVLVAWYNAVNDRLIGTQTSTSGPGDYVCAAVRHLPCNQEAIGLLAG